MAEEQAGTPEQFAALFGGGPKPGHAEMVAAAHPPDQDTPQPEGKDASPLTSNQARAGTEFGLADAVASRLRGADYAEVSADARTLSDALKNQAEGDVPDHVKLARAAIAAAAANPNAAELQALSRVKPDHAAISALLEGEGEK